MIWQVGEWLVEPALDEIRRADARVKLDPRAMAVLVHLIERAGAVVSAEQLLDEVWKGVIVTQASVYQAIALLRRALEDDSAEPRYIANVPRKGYRLIAPVSRASGPPRSAASAPGDIPDWPAGLPSQFDGLEILRRVGEGASGAVFLAREPALERLVAVKVLRRELVGDAVARARFQREALAAARINHPNVAIVFRVGELANGTLYIVQEYIEGHTLADILRVEGARSVAECVALVRDIAAALAAADAKRILHRDVRPGNVLIAKDSGRAVLTDFGVAGLQETGHGTADRLTRAGERLGDTRYASPEQLRGEALTGASDVYSLGIVARELLARRDELPAGLAQLLRRCLAGQPHERPTAADLVRLLAVVSRAVHGRRASDSGRRRGWYAAAVLLVAVVLIAAWRLQNT